MKSVNIIFFLIMILSSCSQSESKSKDIEVRGELPNEIIKTDEGFNRLKESVTADFLNLEDEIEVLEFYYSGSVGFSDGEISSLIHLQFVKGDDKNSIVEYSINSEGSLSIAGIEISTGDIGKEKISNSYETYKPFLFSSKLINLDIVRQCISSSIEQFIKDANCPEAYCASVSIEFDNRRELEISINIKQKKSSTTLSRYYDWTIDGKQKS